MLTVRYPSGFSVQYNSANRVVYDSALGRLYSRTNAERADGRDGTWVADVPLSAGAIIEAVRPCATYDAMALSPSKLADLALERIKELPRHKLRELKRRLADFDSRTEEWKDAR